MAQTIAQLKAKLARLSKKPKAKTKAKPKAKAKKAGSGLAAYRRKINNAVGVKAKTAKVKKLESDLKKAKAEKAKVIRAAQKKYKAK